MADINIWYRCGCGFGTQNVVEAVIHSDKSQHSLDVVGRITKDKGVKKGKGRLCQSQPGAR
jgi:hypothetical protein